MKITKVETIRVEDRSREYSRALWVQIYTDEGHVGLGETWYGPMAVEGAVHELFAPMLIGRNPLDIEGHWYNMFRLADHWGYGGAETRAISAIDTALWDIAGQDANRPIYAMLGGACRDRIRVYNTGGGPNFRTDPVPHVTELLERGITHMKVGAYPDAHEGDGYYVSDSEIERLVDPIRRIHEAVGNRMSIAIDGHGFWSLHNAIRVARALEPYNIFWLEEMLSPRNVDAHLQLAHEAKFPVCLAERFVTRYQFREFIEKGAVEIVMPDLIWTGGVSETKKIAILAETHQLPVCPHDCTGPVNVFACAHICMNAPNAMLQETIRQYYEGWYGDIVTTNITIKDGYLLAPEGPGLGTSLRPEVRLRPDARIVVTDKTEGHYLGWRQ
ncbi:MAG: mandelate racemase/muconate lactonizing enzyme family protein [Chloroflexi bacterium]|nr:mandelate racemase/muconate lactonizing enzyme family protein [Chloroflexota bacterium]